jgi:hypothetical protein
MKSLAICGLLAGLLCTASAAKAAVPLLPAQLSDSPIVLAADGCGPGWYRGPGGACHRFGYGPGPGWWRARYNCGGHRAWVPGPYGYWHWAWIPNC